MTLHDELKYLLEKYLSHQLREEERTRFLFLLHQHENQSLLEDLIESVLNQGHDQEPLASNKQQIFEAVIKEAEIRTPSAQAEIIDSFTRHQNRPRWILYVAAAVLFLSAGTWLLTNQGLKIHQEMAKNKAVGMLPVGNGALLTLADGSEVVLNDAKKGLLKSEKGLRILKSNKEEITYSNTGSAGAADITRYNTITTLKGGQYHITLPDKTNVWLNAASSLKFPLSFSAKNRTVILSGEGYFEVSRDTNRPFIVKVNDMQVNVLGTHFNVMAYNDEGTVETTLVKGSVQLSNHGEHVVLKPGQQGRLSQQSEKFTISRPRIDQIMAWKNGEFRFENTEIGTIMRQLSRWYDLSVVYKGDISEVKLSGVLSRKEEVSQLLEILEATHKVHFDIKGNKITVLPD